jgi:hypothetical protein
MEVERPVQKDEAFAEADTTGLAFTFRLTVFVAEQPEPFVPVTV